MALSVSSDGRKKELCNFRRPETEREGGDSDDEEGVIDQDAGNAQSGKFCGGKEGAGEVGEFEKGLKGKGAKGGGDVLKHLNGCQGADESHYQTCRNTTFYLILSFLWDDCEPLFHIDPFLSQTFFHMG